MLKKLEVLSAAFWAWAAVYETLEVPQLGYEEIA